MPSKTFFNLPQKKRTRIINAAIGEFSKMHYTKVTIDNIVNKAEIPKGSFYQYFKNKNDIYKFIFSQISNEKAQILDKTREEINTLSFKDYIFLLLDEAANYEASDSQLIKLKDKFINECPQELRKEVLKSEIPKSYAFFESVIRIYIKKGELSDDLNIKVAAYMITLCIVNTNAYDYAPQEDVLGVISQIIDILIHGMKQNK